MMKRELRAIDSVQINGWTPDAVARGVSALSLMVVKCQPESEDSELGLEMLRWLQYAAKVDAEGLADGMAGYRPSGPDASPWDRVEIMLAAPLPLDELVTRLKEMHPDPVSTLCTWLDETAPDDVQWSHLERRCQRAVEALVTLETDESLSYLLRRVSLLCCNNKESLEGVIPQHRAALGVIAVKVWPLLGWRDRATLLLFLQEYEIPRDGVIELVFSTDGRALDYPDRARLVDALVFTSDPRAVSVVHELVDHALEDVSRTSTAAGRSFLTSAMCQLHGVESAPTLEQYRRALACGVLSRYLTEPLGAH